jgi:hypothetical protein
MAWGVHIGMGVGCLMFSVSPKVRGCKGVALELSTLLLLRGGFCIFSAVRNDFLRHRGCSRNV